MRATVFVGVFLLVLGACDLTRPAPGVCCSSLADCNSIGATGEEERPCGGSLVCVDHTCTPPTCTIDSDCGGDLHCAPDQACVTCLVNDHCQAEAPFCSPDHSCVECLDSDQCGPNKPVCDLESHTCTTCTTDDECASAVCDTDTGMCLDESAVIYAAPGAPNNTSCAKDDPCSVASAFAVANVARDTIKLAPGAYIANITVTDKRVVIHGAGATLSATAGTTLFAESRARLRAIGLSIVNTGVGGANGKGFECRSGVDRPFIELDQVTIDSMSFPFTANGCDATLRQSHLHVRTAQNVISANSTSDVLLERSLVDGAGGGGILANASTVRLTNSVIADQTATGGFNGLNGIGGALIISFSTIVNSNVSCGSGTGSAVCSGASLDGTCIDNSIVFNLAGPNTITSSKCTVNFSIISPQSASVAGANNMLGADPMFVSVGGSDFHLQLGSPAIDAADPGAINVIDFDGTGRPQGPRNDLGAFEHAP